MSDIDLKPDPNNANRGTPRGHGIIEQSIRRHGAGRSGLAANDGTMIAGSQTLEEMAALGIPIKTIHTTGEEWVVVVRDDIEPGSETAALMAVEDNRASELGLDWNPDVLDGLIGEGIDLSTLFRDGELPITVGEIVPGDGGDDFDTSPSDGPTRTQPGDLWRIGPHRLLVGDCTDPANVAQLMGGERAKLTMTSPPYWVGKDYEQEQTWEDIQSFIIRCAAVIVKYTTHRIVINTGAPQAARLTGKRAHVRLLLDDWQSAFDSLGFLMRYVRIWTKRGGLLHTAPESDCIDQHWEFIATFYDPEVYEGQRRVGEPWATEGLWEMHGEMSSGGHTAAFPVEIPRRNILLHTDPGDLIYEPFMGSGVTLIAAHREGRICYGCDVTPKYADTALRRAEAEGLSCERAE